MQAYHLYHGHREDDNKELVSKFIALRSSRNTYVRSLYRRRSINPNEMDILLRLIHTCDYEELINILGILKQIPLVGYHICYKKLLEIVKPKEVTPLYRKRTPPNLTISTFPELQGLTPQELQLRTSFINRGKRLLNKKQSKGLISYQDKEKILNNTLTIRTSLDAQNWYHSLLADTFNQALPKTYYCEHCPHCQALKNNLPPKESSSINDSDYDSDEDKEDQEE